MPETKPGRPGAGCTGAAYTRLQEIIELGGMDAAGFRRALDEALAAGFPINYTSPEDDSWTLLYLATYIDNPAGAAFAQVLIEAGADVNAQNCRGHTPLGNACLHYVWNGRLDNLALINMLLAVGARPELDERWKRSVDIRQNPDRLARRDWLAPYVDTWGERRAARDRDRDAAPGFDYAL